jgi:DNA-binding IclR family transcriptional regulator
VNAARVNGYSVDEGDYIAGVTILAAPVLDGGGRMTHAVVAVGLREQFERSGAAGLAQELRAAAAALSERLHGGG